MNQKLQDATPNAFPFEMYRESSRRARGDRTGRDAPRICEDRRAETQMSQNQTPARPFVLSFAFALWSTCI